MTCKALTLIAPRVLVLAACVSGAIVCPVAPAAGSAPDPSVGCGAQPPLPARDYTAADWPIRQSGSNGQIVGRTFNVHVPKLHEQPQRTPLAIVINLHGSGQTGARQDKGSRMRELGDEKGIVVASPDAWPWSQWTNSEDEVKDRNGFSDVEFIRALLDILIDKLCVDRNRIYATGASNGGVMSATLGRASAEGKLGVHKIAAVAPVASMPMPSRAPSSKLATASAFSVYIPPSADWVDKIRNRTVPREGGTRREPMPMHVFYGNQDRVVANGACYALHEPWVYNQIDDFNIVILFRKYMCSCYDPAPADPRVCAPRPGPPAIQGNVDNFAELALYAVNYWALENGCTQNFDVLPTGNSGWGVPVGEVKFDCAVVSNSRGDTFLTIYDTTESLPNHPNSVEQPNGHIWPGGVRPDGVEEGNVKVTNKIWAFFEMHAR